MVCICSVMAVTASKVLRLEPFTEPEPALYVQPVLSICMAALFFLMLITISLSLLTFNKKNNNNDVAKLLFLLIYIRHKSRPLNKKHILPLAQCFYFTCGCNVERGRFKIYQLHVAWNRKPRWVFTRCEPLIEWWFVLNGWVVCHCKVWDSLSTLLTQVTVLC